MVDRPPLSGALEEPGSGASSPAPAYPTDTQTRVGQTIGRIRLEARLGIGGMGEVYRGFDERLQRRVAVKTVRAEHRLSEEMKARFLREARILSKLAHPAICQVYELFEDADTDYLIFELVDGTTLHDLAKKGRLEQSRVLELGSQIADALAVAHREKIVHRDLKPHNVMVTADGGVKVLDFGLAFPGNLGDLEIPAFRQRPGGYVHPVDGGSTVLLSDEIDAAGEPLDATQFSGSTLTPHGTVVGTIRYMSPEQARGAELEPASDLYSLGIVLQELLTGERAYPEASGLELLQHVTSGESRPIRGVDPEVARLVEDLKHPTPSRRPSALETAERLRWLLGRPLRQRRRQLRLAAAAGAFVVLALVLALVSYLAFTAAQARDRAEELALRLREEANRANREAETSQQVLEFLLDLFGKADPLGTNPQAKSELSARELVQEGLQQIGESLETQPVARARIEAVLGSLTTLVGDPREGLRLLEESLRIVESGGASSTVRVQTLNDLGTAYLLNDRLDEAWRVLEQARELLEGSPEPRLAQRADNHRGLGIVAVLSGDPAKAADHFRQALELLTQTPGARPADIFDALVNLATLAQQLGQLDEAERLFDRALAIHTDHGFADNARFAQMLNNLGILKRDLGHFEEAESCHRRAIELAEIFYEPGNPTLASMLDSLARLYNRLDRPREALPLLQRSLRLLERSGGARHFESGIARLRLADAYRQLGQWAAADREFQQGQTLLDAAAGAEHPKQVEALTIRAGLEHARGKASAARATLERALALAQAKYGPEHAETRLVAAQLARLPP